MLLPTSLHSLSGLAVVSQWNSHPVKHKARRKLSSMGAGRAPDGGSWWKRYDCREESAVQRVYSENNEGGMGIYRDQ